MKVPDPYVNYPPRWADYTARGKLAYKVFSSATHTNRFGARYRLAKAFKGLNLDGYTNATARGYDALTRATLTWSAFELFLLATRRDKTAIPAISAAFDFRPCLEELRKADPEGRFFKFVFEGLDSAAQKAEVDKFLKGAPCCAITLARAVRHIYIHGPLTPNANQASPDLVEAACNRLSQQLVEIMDREFVALVEQLVAVHRPLDKPEPSDDFPF